MLILSEQGQNAYLIIYFRFVTAFQFRFFVSMFVFYRILIEFLFLFNLRKSHKVQRFISYQFFTFGIVRIANLKREWSLDIVEKINSGRTIWFEHFFFRKNINNSVRKTIIKRSNLESIKKMAAWRKSRNVMWNSDGWNWDERIHQIELRLLSTTIESGCLLFLFNKFEYIDCN